MIDEFARLQRAARRRARAGRRAGLPGRQLPADDRDAERDRHAGAQRRVLRAAGRGDQHLPRARAGRSRRTTSSAWRAAYIKPDRLSIVLVGNAKAFVPQLRAVGFTDFEVIPIEQLDLMSATLRREPTARLERAVEPSAGRRSRLVRHRCVRREQAESQAPVAQRGRRVPQPAERRAPPNVPTATDVRTTGRRGSAPPRRRSARAACRR